MKQAFLLSIASLWIALSGLAAAKVVGAQEPAKKIRVAVVPMLNTSEPRFPNVLRDAVRERTNRIASDWFRAAIVDADYEPAQEAEVTDALSRLELDFSKDRQRSKENLAKLGKELGAAFVVLACVTACEQRNAEGSAILGNLKGPQSRSKAEVRVWLLDAASDRLILDGKAFTAEVGGPFFGTTRRSELSGNPQDVQYMIMHENKRRAEYIGKAAAAALYSGLGAIMGLKLVPK